MRFPPTSTVMDTSNVLFCRTFQGEIVVTSSNETPALPTLILPHQVLASSFLAPIIFNSYEISGFTENIHKHCLTSVRLREREIRVFEWRDSEHISTLFYPVSPCEVFKPNLRHTMDEKRLALLNASILWLMLYFLTH